MTKTDLPEVPIAIVHRPGQEPGITMPYSAFLRLVALARETVEREAAGHRVPAPPDPEFLSRIYKESRAKSDLEARLRRISVDLELLRETLAEVFGVAALEQDDEDLADRVALEAARRSGEETVPHELVKRLLAGDHPVKVYREQRGLTQAQLAERTQLSSIYISQIETGRRGGGTKTLKRIARTLDVDLDDLASWDEDTETPQDKAPTRAVKRARVKPGPVTAPKRARPLTAPAKPARARKRPRRD